VRKKAALICGRTEVRAGERTQNRFAFENTCTGESRAGQSAGMLWLVLLTERKETRKSLE
jgi:hypothetical protein